MPDTFARMRQLVGTTAEWAVNDLVIGLGEIAVEKAGGESKLKVGDGSSRFSALPYAGGSSGGSVAWGNITGKPAQFPPSAHVHALTDVTGLVDGAGNIQMELIPDTLKERLDWKGQHTPAVGAEYPLVPAAGDTWGILGGSYTFATGTLSGKTVSEGAAIVFDNARWYIIGGGAGGASGDFVEVADLTTTSTGPTMAGKVPQLSTSGRLDPSLLNIPGALNFRGTVNITLPVPGAVNQGDYYIVGIGGVAHASWTGIAGLTMLVQDQVIWTGVAWTYIRPVGGTSGFLPIDGSAPMTGALSLAAYTAGQPAAAHAIRKDNLDARIAALPTAQASLGFLPMNPANNLSEVVDDATARSNIGLTATATMAPTAFIQTSIFTLAKQIPISTGAGAVSVIVPPAGNNLLLATDGAGAVGWRTDWFLDTASNLADVPDKAAARVNLGVPDLADIVLKSTIDAAGDLLVGTGPDAVTRLGKGTTGQVLSATAGGLAWATPASGGLVLVGEAIGTGATAFLNVNFPAGAKVVELFWFLVAAPTANVTIGVRGSVGGTPQTFAKYHAGNIVQSLAGTSVGAEQITAATSWTVTVGAVCWGKASIVMPTLGYGVADFAYRNAAGARSRVMSNWETDETMTAFTGYYFSVSSGNFTANSYVRCYASA